MFDDESFERKESESAFNGFNTDEEGYSYAYNEGHGDSRKKGRGYHPNPAKSDLKGFKGALRQQAAEDEDLCVDCWDREGKVETVKTQNCSVCGEGLCDVCGNIATGGCNWETIVCNSDHCFDVHVEGCSSCSEYIEENEAESFSADSTA